MRRFILSIIIITVCFSCSNDDNSSTSNNNDPILGVWGNYADTYIDDNGKEVIDEVFDPYSSVNTFNPDGSLIAKDRFFGEFKGTWKNLGNNEYEIKLSIFNSIFNIQFICKGNVMKWDDDGGYMYYERIGYDNKSCDEAKLK